MKRVILLTMMLSFFSGCRLDNSTPMMQDYAKGEELCCIAESLDEAQKIAQDYGIELVRYNDGVAVFHTEDNPYDVVKSGKKKGYTELSVNTYVKKNK